MHLKLDPFRSNSCFSQTSGEIHGFSFLDEFPHRGLLVAFTFLAAAAKIDQMSRPAATESFVEQKLNLAINNTERYDSGSQ